VSKTRIVYFERDDVLHLVISDEPEAGSVELSPNVTAELNAKGELIGVEILNASAFLRDSILEILNASAFLRDSILESVQAKMLSLSSVQLAGSTA